MQSKGRFENVDWVADWVGWLMVVCGIAVLEESKI